MQSTQSKTFSLAHEKLSSWGGSGFCYVAVLLTLLSLLSQTLSRNVANKFWLVKNTQKPVRAWLLHLITISRSCTVRNHWQYQAVDSAPQSSLRLCCCCSGIGCKGMFLSSPAHDFVFSPVLGESHSFLDYETDRTYRAGGYCLFIGMISYPTF